MCVPLLSALNHYSSRYYQATPPPNKHASDYEPQGWFEDQLALVGNINASGHVIGPVAESDWLNVVPKGIGDMLVWIAERYENPPLYITENGVDAPGEAETPLPAVLNDTFRVEYFQGYLDSVFEAKDTRGVNVQGYFAWSLLDNFEWNDGYHCRFGLHYVDYSSPDLTRYRKKSAEFITKYIQKYTMRMENVARQIS